MGGQIALYLAARLAPERVNRLVCVAGVVTGRFYKWVEQVIIPQFRLGAQMPFLYDFVYRFSRSSLFGRFFYSPWFYRMASLPYDAWELDRQMASQRTIAHATERSWSSARTTDLSGDLGSIQSPTLLIHGQQDLVAPVSESLVIRTGIPGTRLVLIDQCGHFPMYEQRDQYLDALLAFFR